MVLRNKADFRICTALGYTYPSELLLLAVGYAPVR
jgi:hypothetical protein